MKPTVINCGGGDESPPPKKPTVMPSSEEKKQEAIADEKGPQKPPTPTIIRSTAPSVAQPKASRVSVPTIIGVQRKHILVTRDALRTKHQLKDAVLDQAISIIQNTHQDELTMRDVITWGQQFQETYGTLVNDALTFARSECIQAAQVHVSRVLALLGDIQLEKVLEEKVTFLSHALRSVSDEIDTPVKLDRALHEISQLSGLMHERLPELLNLRESFDSNSKQIGKLGDTVEAAMIAALELSEYFNRREDEHKELGPRFHERANSLTATLALIRSGSTLRDVHVTQPMELITLIQEVVFNTLPAWMTNVTALRMAIDSQNRPNPTEISEVSRIQKNIIQKLS